MSATAYSRADFADLDDESIAQSYANRRRPESTWPAPDMSVLNASRRVAVPMPTDLFGPALPVLSALSAGTSTPVDYPATAYLATCASLIGGRRRVRPYATSNWAEPCILWVGIVGDPSSRKSPALEAVVDPLRVLERDGAELHKADLRAWREADAKAKTVRTEWERSLAKAVKEGHADLPAMPDAATEPDEPHRRRTLVMDATPEAVGAILAGNHMGTLHYRDELAGWLQSFERYSPGGREFWLEAYGGRSFVIDRKGAKAPLSIPFNGVSVLGGIQPAKLADTLLSSVDDGLVARFLWAWPDKLAFTRPTQSANMALLEAAYRRLEGLTWGRDGDGQPIAITLPLSRTAADLFEAWQRDNAEIDGDADGLLKSFYGKLDGALLRIALTAELAGWAWRGGEEPVEVSLSTITAAAEWIDDYAKPMAARVYGDAALPKAERNAATLARYIVKQAFQIFNKRDLKRSPHKSNLRALTDAKDMDAALEVLTDAGWILKTGEREGGGAGRAKADFIVNPAVHGGRK